MEEVPVGLPFPHPAVEEMIHQSIIAIEHIDVPNGRQHEADAAEDVYAS